MVITFSNIKGSGGGGATGGTVSGITLWSSDYTQEYIDNALSGVTDALSAYTPTSGFSTINGSAITTGDNLVIEGTPYSGGTNIDITDHVISVTGITVPTKVSDLENDEGFITSGAIPTSNTAFTNDAGFITSGDAQTQIDNAVSGKMDTAAMSAYTPTSGFSTINGSAITEGGNITVEETPYSAGTGIGISEHVISVTGDYETVVELTQAEYDALTAYSENTTYIITDEPAINMSAYTPTSGFSTINGSAITTGEAIVIEETPYSAGTNINIANHVISVTGITIPTSNTAFTNDAGYITTADTKDFVTSGDVKTQIEDYGYITSDALSGYSTTEEMNQAIDDAVSGKADTSALTQYYTSAETNTAISNAVSGLASTEYVDNSVSGKADTSAVTAAITAATAATTGWVENQGYLTTESDPIFTGSPAYGITAQDITNWNSVSGKVDTSAMTAYYTSGETNTAISNATSGLASTTYVDDAVSGKQDTSAMTAYATTGWVNEQGFLTAFTETDPVFMASAASGITAQDITNWNAVSGKQDTLVNQVNIKSINGTSLLGSGNIQISEGGTYTGGDNIEITAQNVINVTGITSYTGITSGDVVTALGYTPISGVDLSEYYTSAQTNTAISNAVSGKADSSRVDEIEEVTASALTDLNNRMITTGAVQSMITAATDGLASTTYVDNSVSGKADTSALTQYYTSAQTNTAINNATSGLASITYVNNSVSGKMDTSAMTQYATTGSVVDVENHIDEVEEVVASALTDLHTTKQDTLVSGTNIKTINNQSLLGSGNITIQGGGGGDVTIIELTQAQYDALTAYTEDAIYVITDAPVYDITNYELLSNKVTSISSASTDTQYPSAKCVYDLVGDIESLLASI